MTMTAIKVSDLSGAALDWAVAKCEGEEYSQVPTVNGIGMEFPATNYSTDWGLGGPILDRMNITTIRANDTYEVDDKGFTTTQRIPQWFAECDQWTGHSLTTSYEGENMDPTFMIGEAGGYYGTTRLIAGFRALVAFKLGAEVQVPIELVQGVQNTLKREQPHADSVEQQEPQHAQVTTKSVRRKGP
ncbi:phage protein NinX family protein [Hydrogenophaga sp. 2FB]|uniref:phage protein NinX family protein n=1 Tax=Hydrogenophaga sp. 2FB TaxID=2502187 RepID=UPI0010F9F6AB|nr:phage protein NinX family protein [Hydrogenophaga sp. 2FB]